MRITVPYSLPTRRSVKTSYAATDEDTKSTATAVAAALTSNGAQVTLLPISEDTIGDIRGISADCIFNLIEWDGLDMALALQAFGELESLGIPFTGVSRAALEGIADKVRMKEALTSAGLPTPEWQLFQTGKETIGKALPFPVIVKPLYEHCSVGLTHEAVVSEPKKLVQIVRKQLAHYQQPVFAEEFIIGREFQVTVVARAGGIDVLHPSEILFTTAGTRAFLTYGGRWDPKDPDWTISTAVLAKLSAVLQSKLIEVSKRAFRTLMYRDYSRLDIRTRGSDVFILEANANPGVEDSTGYGMSISFHAEGMNFSDFLWEIVDSALRRKHPGR